MTEKKPNAGAAYVNFHVKPNPGGFVVRVEVNPDLLEPGELDRVVEIGLRHAAALLLTAMESRLRDQLFDQMRLELEAQGKTLRPLFRP